MAAVLVTGIIVGGSLEVPLGFCIQLGVLDRHKRSTDGAVARPGDLRHESGAG